MITESRTDYAGFNTRILRCDGDGPSIVLLHGIFDSADTWKGVLSALAHRGRRAIAVDLPGYGDADPRAPGPALPQLDAFVAELVTSQAQTKPVVLVGNSLGGALAVRAALTEDMPIHSVIPIDVAGLGYRPWIEATIGRYSPPATLLSRIPYPRRVARSRAATKLVSRSLYAHAANADPTVVARFVQRASDPREIALVAAEGRAMLRELHTSRPTGDSPPMLILHGRRDFLIPPSGSERLHRRYPESELAILEHCGHCPQLDDPGLIADLIANFSPRE
ncbi:alpha/beta hydrolase [Hoyosella rhizosphaerae]|uniref:Alpha/beta hydrolase fold protein n=1 Tax=Hoyosella rhizosphaerae TaxID=1755582 RepID=A0A916X9X0_9ACTN|nr:alpha/beta hydrolase [Hoyosella rhizosphaerae]MBN4926871.1 alpha/beta hydrolase [Hoyosella rhizosphaerae]GGC55873.1 alpha/beta hydrolase fold protein [Hoyosella rhizosphaerae]